MVLLDKIHTGRRHSPPRLLIYGTEGIGKSTTATRSAPSPSHPHEDGLIIDCRFPGPHPGRRRLAHSSAKSTTSKRWCDSLTGSNAGWDVLCRSGVSSRRRSTAATPKLPHALTHWRKGPGFLNTPAQRGMCVILCPCHEKIETRRPRYDRYSPRLHGT